VIEIKTNDNDLSECEDRIESIAERSCNQWTEHKIKLRKNNLNVN
jgi:hypothetical protein